MRYPGGAITIRRSLIMSIRLCATAGLLWVLAVRLDFGRAAQMMAHAAPLLLIAALVALLTGNLIVALRWHLILSAEAPSPGPGALVKLVLVGLFFNQVLPTGVGGDAVRAWRCRKLGIDLGAAIRSILLDRFCGYLVLVAVYAASLPSLLNILAYPRQREVVIAVLGAGLLGLAALFLFDRLPRPLLGLRLIAPIGELSREARRLFTHPSRAEIRCDRQALALAGR